jgi:hypothetical protein
MDQSPWFSQPDPRKQFFVAATPKRLVRRGPHSYFMVGTNPDGREVEVRLTAGSFRMEGLR